MKDIKVFESDKMRLLFAWYDIRVGVFIDKGKRGLNIFLTPCFLLTVKI